MKNTIVVTFLISFLFAGIPALTQQRFALTISLPLDLPAVNLQVWLDDISGDRMLRLTIQNTTTIKVTDTFHSAFAVVRLKAIRKSGQGVTSEAFFIGTRPAVLSIDKPSDSLHPFGHLELTNIWDFKADKLDMEKFVSMELKRALDFEAANSGKLAKGDNQIWDVYNGIMDSLRKKQLQYVAQHPESYWSFYIFRAYLLRYAPRSPDTMYSVFMKFPEAFRFTDEGARISTNLYGVQQLLGSTAPDFTSTDIFGKSISLSSFSGRKYVLLHFWATWCVPCIEELPALQRLNETYRGREFQMITIAYQSAKATDYMPVVNKYGMDWINIYNDRKLLNAYGNPPTPQLILVDQSGAIIFNSISNINKESMLKALADLLQELLKLSTAASVKQ
jgi:thiol-disulfide isomerase/thioredoxin